MNRKGIVPVKRIASIIVVSALAVSLGAATWLLTNLSPLHLEKLAPTGARIQAPGFSDPLADPAAPFGTPGNPTDGTQWISLGGDPGDPPLLTVNQEFPGLATIELKLPGFYLESVTVADRRSSRISLPGQIKLLATGFPELPVLARSLTVPGGGEVRIRIREHAVRELAIDPVEPSKGHLDRSRDPADVRAFFSDFYDGDGIWPPEPAVLGRPFILRDQRGVNVRLQPLRYDAATGRLLISTKLVLEIATTGFDGLNKSALDPSYAPEFAGVYQRFFGNYDEPTNLEKYQPLPTRGRMLIVSDEAFVEDLEPFIRWKRRLGITVGLLTTAQTGRTAEAIGQALQAFFDEPEGLTWAILVGDKEQVPTNSGLYDGSDSDSRYALLAGDDEYPDIYVSRISASSRDHVQTQVAKFVAYEQQPATGAQAAWYGRSAGIASDEGIPADYERVEWLRTDLLGYGYHTVDRLYQSLGGTTAGIRAALEEGCSLINYLGHGTGTGWTSVPFSSLDVRGLDNPGRTPWIIDVSCSNGDFALDECFAEAWLRAGSPLEPRGAVAAISASSLAPWIPPTVMQAEIVDLLTTGQATSLGSLYYGGLMKVLDLYAGLPEALRVMEQNVVFGDCSLMVRSSAPEEFQVTDPGPLDTASTSWSVTVDGPAGSIVTLTDNGILFGIGFVQPGTPVEVPIMRSLADVTQLDLTVSGFNRTPFLGTVNVGSGQISGPEPGTETSPTVDPARPAQARLLGNHPNPFNPDTRIVFELPRRMRIRLRVHDIRGGLVATLIDGSREAGRQEAVWNGRDRNGGTAASGIYLYRLETEDGAITGRMTLDK